MNAGYAYREQVGPEADDLLVAPFLAGRHPHSSLDAWEARVRSGEVEVGGARVDVGRRLAAGEWLVWHRPPWEEPQVPTDFRVVAEDRHLLAVDKPSGLPAMPAGGFLENTLLARVRLRDPDWAPLHRLGRGTSGVMLFSRTPEARSRLQAAWRDGEVEKDYLAVAEGAPPWDTLTIDQPIGPICHPQLGTVHAAQPGGRASRSSVEVVARGQQQSLCRVRIATGRPHQIRIHLAWAGHPLVGDPLYARGGGLRPEINGVSALPGDGGYLLHAQRLNVPHPESGARVTFEADVPAGYHAR